MINVDEPADKKSETSKYLILISHGIAGYFSIKNKGIFSSDKEKRILIYVLESKPGSFQRYSLSNIILFKLPLAKSQLLQEVFAN